MTGNIKFCECQGGEKGEKCKTAIEEACGKFFSCDLKEIEKFCNAESSKRQREWKTKDQSSSMREYGLPDKTFSDGIKEAEPLFELYEPELIKIYILEDERSSVNPKAAMDTKPLDEELRKWELHAYLDVMGYSDGLLEWTGFDLSIEEVTYHELLHACGDDNNWRKGRIVDGVIRHNIIGVTSVKECLKRQTVNNIEA
jgi:hypothetical protein